MSDNTIRFTEIIETEFGEKCVLESPYEAKNYINALAWNEEEDYDESRLDEGETIPDFDFPEGFATHKNWDSENSRWTVDAEAVPVLTEYFEAAGFEVDASNVQMQQKL